MLIKRHQELPVFRHAIDIAVDVFGLCKAFPPFERNLLVSQWLRASRSVPANIAEAWRKRYYRAHFLSKLSDAEAEAAECQVWALLSYRYGYLAETTSLEITARYEEILAELSGMARSAKQWQFRRG